MNFDRQAGIVSSTALSSLPPIIMIGCGGIGSTSGLMLAKMGVKEMHVVDFDTIEEHNIPNQLFPVNTIGRDKVSAMRDVIHQYADTCEVFSYKEKFSNELFEQLLSVMESDPIIIMAVDNMQSRRDIFDIVRNNASFIVDGRMGGWLYHVYAITPDLYDWYDKEELHTDAESTPIPCTERAIIFNTAGVGSDICKNIALYANNEERRKKITRDIRNDAIYID